MVSNVHQEGGNYNDSNNNAYSNENPRTLCDWVRQFRLKKIQMKRKLKLGGDLRVCAILTTALMRTELELKRKQQERFQRWLEFQAKIDSSNNNYDSEKKSNQSAICNYNSQSINEETKSHDKTRLSQHNSKDKSDEIEKLWKCELSDLDNFLRSISNTTVNNKKSASVSSSSCSRRSSLLINSNCSQTAVAEYSREHHHTSVLQISREQSVIS